VSDDCFEITKQHPLMHIHR